MRVPADLHLTYIGTRLNFFFLSMHSSITFLCMHMMLQIMITPIMWLVYNWKLTSGWPFVFVLFCYVVVSSRSCGVVCSQFPLFFLFIYFFYKRRPLTLEKHNFVLQGDLA